MTEQVARINTATQDYLLLNAPGIEIVIDANSAIVIAIEEAELLLSPSQYLIIDWAPPQIGLPKPKPRRPKNH